MLELARSLVLNLIVRYAVALLVGFSFLFVYGLSNGNGYMSHLGMLGKIMVYDWGLGILIEVPAWLGLSLLLQKLINRWSAEMISASIVSLVYSQKMYLYMLVDALSVGYIDPELKVPMLIWYISTTTNWLLALVAAITFCMLKDAFDYRRAKKGLNERE